MKPLVMQRSPAAAYLLAAAAVTAHVLLCRPAAICRGYPPIHPFWECVAPFLAYLAILLFPLCDNRPATLRCVRNCFLWPALLMNGIVTVNLTSGRPSIGHLVGIIGIISENSIELLISTAFISVLAYPAALLAEAFATRAWRQCREFTEPGASGSALRFTTTGLLGGVAAIAVLCSVAAWGYRAYHSWPNRTWSHACRNHLRQIGLAMQNYHDFFGSLPPAFVADEQGRPMHSWRVLLLPFLGEKKLYDEYRFDEPWNSSHNLALSERIPDVYRCRWDSGAPRNSTSYCVVVGAGTAFPGANSLSYASIGDGTSRTILAVEAPESGILWTEPRDLSFDELTADDEGLSKFLREMHGVGAHARVVFADGHSRSLDRHGPKLFKALLTANGGEVIKEDY